MGQMILSYWNPRETATKTKYNRNIAIPIAFVIFQLNIKMERKTRQSIMNKMATEQTMPSAETGTFWPLIIVNKSQGKGSLKSENSR